MEKLSHFTCRASAEARSVAKCSRHSSSDSTPTPLRPDCHAPDSAPPAQKSACATATVTSAAGTSSDAPTPTQAALLLQIPALVSSWHMLMAWCLRVCRCWPLVRHGGPVASPAVASAPQSSPPLSGFRTSIPPMIFSRLTLTIRYPRRGVLPLRCPRLGHLSWHGLNQSICQCHRNRDFHRSCCHRIGITKILMCTRRTSTPCLILHQYRMVICLPSRQPLLGARHHLPWNGMQSLSIAPMLVRQPRRCCRSHTRLLISRSWHPHRLLICRWSSSTHIPSRWYSWPRPIWSGCPSLHQILFRSWLHLYSVRMAYSFTTPNSLSGCGHRSLPACSADVPGETLHAAIQFQWDADPRALTSWPPILTFCNSTPLACTV